jgi:hypothetical protein
MSTRLRQRLYPTPLLDDMNIGPVVTIAQPLPSHRAEPRQIWHSVEEVVSRRVAVVGAVTDLTVHDTEHVVNESALLLFGCCCIHITDAAEEAAFARLPVGGEA